jgi:hypothetical protein
MGLHDELAKLSWLEPWAPLSPEDAREREADLAACLVEAHPLHGRSARALAARTDEASDVLFLVTSPEQLAVVNLVPARKGKGTAHAPFFMLHDSVEEFEQACMLPDHLEYSDADTD